MSVLNPEWEPESWKHILDFIVTIYFCGSYYLFYLGLIIAFVFSLLITIGGLP